MLKVVCSKRSWFRTKALAASTGAMAFQTRNASVETPSSKSHRNCTFLEFNDRPCKPRSFGMTEIRGPYYSVMGHRYLQDILDTMGHYVDGLKFAGGSFSLMPREAVKQITSTAHQYGVYVSTGGWAEHILAKGAHLFQPYLEEVKDLGFDVVELSTGFISIPQEDLVQLVRSVKDAGLKAKPELGIQFGAGGDTATAELAAEGTRDAEWVIQRAKACLDAGADMIMIESEGITENVETWRTDVVAKIIGQLGLEKVMFEAAEPKVFEWYLKNYGNRVTDQYFLEKLLNLKGDDGFQMNQVMSCLWYIMGLWPAIYWMLLIPTGRSSGNKIPIWPFTSLSFFAGAFALLPYFGLWQPPAPKVSKEEIQGWPLRILDSKIFAIIVAIAGLGLLGTAATAGGESWTEFRKYFNSSRFIHIMSLDFMALSSLAPFWVFNDIEVRKWSNKGSWLPMLAFIPFLGPAVYLILRPPLNQGETD